ncbi:HflK protein [Denitrovibrio acetiphilus DSM 12809]|uniref:Protein HflK n=1 Tax=Denitrovibrio acetiphilus (strain DSM 12809 / NBRC 114555 / N2460) TaxID=522772 RepID=D4H7H4_DENA2|nr:FtsH protease activity modulator HflK [Denitrovibrio acetiphilus]ADD67973.1 HflK protein [Denitrovibrio acetiphilus DSM 12809]
MNNGNGGQSPWGDDKFDLKDKLPKMNFNAPGASVITIVVIVAWLASGFFIVKPSEQAVVKRFGTVVKVVGSGPSYHLPYPIDSVDKAEVTKVHRLEVGFRTTRSGTKSLPQESLMLTGDENIVSINLSVQYKITDITKYLYNVHDVEDAILDITESAIREVAGREKIDDILTSGKNRIQTETQKEIQAILNKYEAGIQITAVQLQDVEPPQEVVNAFKDVASAREDKNRYINEAEAYQNEVIPRARAEAATMLQQAEGYQQEKVARAEGETNRFESVLKSYRAAPAVTKKRLYLETMEKVLAKSDKKIFDSNIKEITPILGLDKAMSGGAK